MTHHLTRTALVVAFTLSLGMASHAADAKAPPKADPKAKKRPTKAQPVGPAVNENKATPVSRIKAPEGFKVELLYSVPGQDHGSWVNLCTDDKNRIIVSDQYGGLYRFAAPAPGKPLNPGSIEKVPADIRAVNGMLWAFGALYVGVNDYERKIDSGVYRITDSDGDDKLDKVEKLRSIKAGSDHGVHAILLSPDKKSLFLITGNNADLTQVNGSRVPMRWGEDHLLKRMPDGRGHNRDRLAPGGIIYRMSPDGQQWEVFSTGFRNIFDAGFNRSGELFTYDADMEYDFNTPWYRPTRVNHVTSGSEWGWRNGAGKRPEWYPDNLPPVINIGPGSPTGVTFGYGAKFPAKYQDALYVLDWSWGKIYAVHLKPEGASYTATKETFITGAPLPVTDAIVHPVDGAMYFAIGGRKVQSGLYRVTYTGSEATIPSKASFSPTKLANLRQELEAFHQGPDKRALSKAWPHLNHEDRFVRWAARTAVMHQPLDQWMNKALKERDYGRRVEAMLGLITMTGVDPLHRKTSDAPVDKALQVRILESLLEVDWSVLTDDQRLTLVRAYEVCFVRFGEPDAAASKRVITQLDPHFPAKTFPLNWVLCETLAYLQSPTAAAKGIGLLQSSPTQEEQLEYARSLRFLKTGWTTALRTAYFNWFLKAASYRGGASFSKFIEFIRNDAVESMSNDERLALKELLDRKPEIKSPMQLLAEAMSGRSFVKEWTLEELSAAATTGLKNRNFETGRKMFAAAGCFACHRFGNEGGMTGPDLTGAGGRYSPHDLLDQIVNPSKEINEQFVPIVVTKLDGDTVTGVVVNLSGDSVTVNTDMFAPNERTSVDRKQVKSIEPSKVSPMPSGLLGMLQKEEVLDLVAYVLSGGDKSNRMFARP